MYTLLVTLVCVASPMEDTVDPNFYLEPRIELDGHLWRPILLQHHPECPCGEGVRELAE